MNVAYNLTEQEQKAAEIAAEGGEIEHSLKRGEDGVFGYLLYRNNSTLEDFMTWDRPVDAVQIPTKLRFCSALQSKNQSFSKQHLINPNISPAFN